jgi:hypothetical protein
MNSKKVKALRRQAEAQTVGQATVAYRATKLRSKVIDGKRMLNTETMVLDPACTRAVYQKLKREATWLGGS